MPFITAPTSAPAALAFAGAVLRPCLRLGGDGIVDHRFEVAGVHRLETLGCCDRLGIAAAVRDDLGEDLLGLRGGEFAVDLQPA